MYIEFRLPYVKNQPINERPAEIAIGMIERDLQRWSKQYNCQYTVRHVDQAYRVFLSDSKLYTLFGMTWAPQYRSSGWKRVSIVKQVWD